MFLSSPSFLWGLLAIAIPVLVHLFNFRRYKKVYFSNVERLEQLQSETRRQSTLRQLLVLAARILAIVFLVLAFAQPVIPSGEGMISHGSNDVSIFIDNSFSMENTDGNQMLLDKAKAKAREIADGFGPSDRFQLLTCDAEGRHFHWLSKEEFLLLVDEVQPTGATMTMAQAVGYQLDFLHEGRGDNKHSFVISDMQASVMDIDAMPTDSTVAVTFVPLAATSQNNVYIDSLSLGVPVVVSGINVPLHVWIRNDGDEDLEKVPLSLYVDGRQRALATVDLPATGSTEVEMSFVADRTGVLDCHVETTDYPVTFDDKYFFSINVKSRIEMLVVEGAGNNEFVERLFGGDSIVSMKRVALQQMDFSRIDGNDIIMLDELPDLSSGMAQSLHTFVSSGGTAVVTVAANADRESYNAALSLFAAPQLGNYHEGRVRAASVNSDNVLYYSVFNSMTKDMEMPSVTGYYSLATTGASVYEPLISLSNGDEYLCVTACGRGRLYLFAAPLRDAHTDFVRQALFVPTLYNMALYSAAPTVPATTIGANGTVILSGNYDLAAASVSIVSAGDGGTDAIADVRLSDGHPVYIPHDEIRSAGNYHLTQEGELYEGISFNYSRLESQMRFLSSGDLAKAVEAQLADNYSVVRNADKPLDKYLKERYEGHRLWRWCLIASLLMLLAETLLLRVGRKAKNA